jgi:beta-galactosidase
MEPITFNSVSYQVGGRAFFLYSGEIHYFRVPKKDWKQRMELLKAAGGNCLATYIPWLIHEPEEGCFRFQSEDGRLDLEDFFRLANELGLYVVARPGPYQYSELVNAGLPAWLIKKYPEMLAQNIDGEVFNHSSVSYIHPVFLAKVKEWFNQVCPIIARYTLSRGGPVAFTQIDNEMVGIHEWSGSLDYNPTSMGFGCREGRYPKFLEHKYRAIRELNAHYETTYETFAEVRPVKPDSLSTPPGIRRAKDYFDFYLSTIAEYAVILRDMMVEQGIDTPIIHNAANPNMNCYFKETIESLGKNFLLGSDHYYNLSQDWPQNNPTPQYAVRTFYSLETLRLMGFPPTVMEMPSGSLSDWPPFTPQDANACYWTNLALGTKGINYYIFTGGPNPPGAGTTSDVYDFSAPVGPFGEVRPVYQVQKELGTFLSERPWFSALQRAVDVRCLLNMEYPRSWNFWRAKGEFPITNSEAQEFLLKGILSTAFCAGLSPALCNADSDDWVNDTNTPLIIVSSVAMAAKIQKRIIQFLENGGKALLAPIVPTLDENLLPCTLLFDYLGQPSILKKKNEQIRVDVAGVLNVYNNGEAFLVEKMPVNANVIGKNAVTGQPLAFSLQTSASGQIIVLCTRWSQAMREHERMLEKLLQMLGIKQRIKSSNPNVWASLQQGEGRSVLFLMNLWTGSMETQVELRLNGDSGLIDAGRHHMEGMSVKIIPIG